MDPRQVFLFNSSLPERHCDAPEWLRRLGPSTRGVVGVNIGNGYIAYAILKILFGYPAKVSHVPNAWEDDLPSSLADEINRNYSHFLYVMQDYIREDFKVLPFERINRFLEKIRIPIVPISLCANSFGGYDPTLHLRLGVHQKRFLSLISEKSPVIGVRGQYSAEVLDRLGVNNVQIIGGPSYFESGPARFVAKRPWNPDRIITDGCYFSHTVPAAVHVLQDELYLIDHLYFKGTAASADVHANSLSAMKRDINVALHSLLEAQCGRMEFFPNFETWERFYDEQDWCLTIGTRLHSAIFSCNRGVPAIVTSGDARARETCECFGIPHRPELDGKCDLASVYEDLDLSAMNGKYAACHEDFLAYLRAHGLERASTRCEGEAFRFPDIEKPTNHRSRNAFLARFSELVEFCDRRIKHCQNLEEQGQCLSQQLKAATDQLRTCQELQQSRIGRAAAQLLRVKKYLFRSGRGRKHEVGIGRESRECSSHY